MVNYGAEIEQIGAESRRRIAMLIEELAEINQRSAVRDRELAEQSAAEMRQFSEEYGEELLQEAEQAVAEAEQAQREAEEQERLAAEAREKHQAIARSVAARRAKDVVVPIDEEDEEAAYYQRKSWLV